MYFVLKMEISVMAVYYRNYVRKKSFFVILDRIPSFLDPEIEV